VRNSSTIVGLKVHTKSIKDFSCSADPQRSYNMSRIQGKNTTPELAFRRELRLQGLCNYRLHPPKIPGKPDIYFSRGKIAVFVNGCFWHRCPYCKPSIPKTHKAFWSKKFSTNVARDKVKRALLKKMGIKSVVFWECQIKKNVQKLVAKLKCDVMRRC
jgi:DNA mismatch endonuclease (patch repair protein)